MRSILFFAFIFMLFFSCKNKPTNTLIIPRNTFKNALISMHIHDGTIKIYNLKNRSLKVDKEQYDSLYTANGITEQSLKYSYMYYTETEELESIYDEVIDSLNIMKSIYDKEEKNK